MVDLKKYADDARYYAVTYFANHKIMSWGDQGEWLRIALVGEEFELRIHAIENPVDDNGTPIMYIDLVACGPNVDRSPSAMPMNILVRAVTLDYWEDGVATALDALIQDGTETIIDNPRWPS